MQLPVVGGGQPGRFLAEAEVRGILSELFDELDLTDKSVLVIVPDGTRTAPLPLFHRTLKDILGRSVAKLDYLVALGTHPLMAPESLQRLLGTEPGDRCKVKNHRWDQVDTFAHLGVLSAEETDRLSGGLLAQKVPVRINRSVTEYDLLVVCGPVFPHEVAGFSGGNKYFFPGVSGPEVIHFTHWLGALATSYQTIGVRDTAVRRVIDRAADFIPRPRLFLCMVTTGKGLVGLYAGDPENAWRKAVDLSARVHIRSVERPYRRVLSVLPKMYEDLWTGAKGMYKLEPVVEDGGEVILYAPHITEVSYTHGRILDQVGYHVRDYFTQQWDKFRHLPWGVLAHSTHLRGAGSYVDGLERSRITVTLATGISEDRCRALGLEYKDPTDICLQDWKDREEEGALLVPRAGETLYRLSC